MKKENVFNKMIGVSTLFTSLATIAIGTISVILMKNEEKRDKLQFQPLFSVIIDTNQSSERPFWDNQEYRIINVGQKTQERPKVQRFSFLVISYSNRDKHMETKTKFCPLDDYFGQDFFSSDYLLDDTIVRSGLSKNNHELFYNLTLDAIQYGQEHPEIAVFVEIQHFFKIEYIDILGEKHLIVKTRDAEINPDQLTEIIKSANVDAQGKTFSINSLNLDEILRTFFSEEFTD
jgi:hypothetical protein